MSEIKIGEIWWWMGTKEPFENGVTNSQVIEKFGEEYKDA